MNTIAWNYRGLSQPKAVRALKALISKNNPSLLFLSEIKISSLTRFTRLSKYLGFPSFEIFLGSDSAGGIALLWKSDIDVRILVSNYNIINALIFSHPADTSWQFIGVYEPPIHHN